jgi:nucleotide-binding universal stress UspA family protein
MFKRMLVAYDGSDTAETALGVAIDLAKRLGAVLSTVSVEEHLPYYAASISEVEGAKEQIDEHFRALTKHARDRAALDGVELETLLRRGHEVEEILDVAREEGADLLVLGFRGHRRIVQQVMGSTALSVVHNAPCSILVVRPRQPAQGFERILVGLDGSPLGRLAFRTAVDFAILYDASVTGVTVRETSPLATAEGRRDPYTAQLKAAAEEHARSAGVVFEHVTLHGHAAGRLRERAREAAADLIVLGATGLEHPWSPTAGGTAGRLVSEAECSVLLVRSPQSAVHVKDVMARAVSSVSPETPLHEVVELLLRRDVKALPVVDGDRRVLGIITGGDLLARGDLNLRLSVKRALDPATLRERLRALLESRKTAADVMTRHVRTVDADTDLGSVIRLMADHRVKRLPVVDHDRRLVGIVGRADILRSIAALPEPPGEIERRLPAVARTVGDAVRTDVPIVALDTPAEAVLEAVVENPLRRVVVVDEAGRVVGLVSDRDLLAGLEARPWLVRVLRGHAPSRRSRTGGSLAGRDRELTAANLMAPSLITVRPGDSLAHAIRLMMQHRVKRLIVVDDGGRCLGLVDRREILRLLAEARTP